MDRFLEGTTACLLGVVFGLFAGSFTEEVRIKKANIVIPFNGKAKFAVENNYVKKEDLTNIGRESINMESTKAITANIR